MDDTSRNFDTEILRFWEKEKIYKFNAKKKGKIFSIDTPPPTVSGDMHVGHAFSYSQQDFIARFWRMWLSGKGQVFYPFGTDDNGLPTERLIEKMNNIKSKDIQRINFIKLCLNSLRRITPVFVQQWKNLGISADYDIFYSTIDMNSQKISQKSFIDLFKAGRIYKKDFPTIWCPECQTAIAQAELEDREENSKFLTIKFSADDKEILISTTRPELIPACVAVFVNPKDKRYEWAKENSPKLGQVKAKVPLFNFEVPVIMDESADMKKGTGAMMICSYGDKYDVEAIARYKLAPKIIFNQNGTIKFNEISKLIQKSDNIELKKNDLLENLGNNIKIKEFRKIIYDLLKIKQFIVKEESISHFLNVHDKCGTEIEFLPTEQWFIKILDKKKEFLNLGRKIKWHPEYMRKRYENWINGLEWDWTISRNRHFGIPIPVWECKSCGEIIFPEEKELPVDPMAIKRTCPQCNGETIAETKVLDTWATSPLTPQIASSLIKNKIKTPYSLRPQAHDIIRTWAFYTIVRRYYEKKQIPWENIMISGFATLEGNKMSKSKGIAINPNEVIKKYGADSLRFWAAGSKLGENLDYREEDVMAGKRFIIKLRNASNFVFMNLKNYKPKKPKKIVPIDKAFLEDLDYRVKLITKNFEEYNYSIAKSKIEEIFWRDFCDNYLEIVKWRVYNGNKQEKESAFYTLYTSLLSIIKMIAPIMPFITEEIYQKYYRKNEKDKSIHISKWPEYNKNSKINESFLFFKDMLFLVRKKKTEKKISMNAEITLTLPKKNKEALESKELMEDFKNVIKATNINGGSKLEIS